MDFQVNGDTYYLGLAEEKREWLVFVSTDKGVRSIPVYVDAPDSETLTKLETKLVQ